jgi:hypothetical protein
VFEFVLDLIISVTEDCMAMITWMIVNADIRYTLKVEALT